MAGGGIFVINGSLGSDEAKLLEMVETPYDSEAVLQELIERYPSLLAGSQVDPDAPRRWMLLRREQAVPDKLDGKERWSLDHLLVDQDGIPTLVEVKRSTDTRIRREVVGQMLDYAANGAVYWPAASLRAAFEGTTGDPDGRIAEALGVTSADLWKNIEVNLAGGKLRLVFLADEIPKELRRVVEFLNGQMKAEVLAVEVKQFTSPLNPQLRTLVARVYGRTEAAADAKRGTATGKQWNEEMFFADMAERFPQGVELALRLLAWARTSGIQVLWGRGTQSGSYNLWAGKTVTGSNAYLAAVRSNGRVELGFGYLKNSAEFADDGSRLELLLRFKTTPGFEWLQPEQFAKYPTFSIDSLAPQATYDGFVAGLAWAAAKFGLLGAPEN